MTTTSTPTIPKAFAWRRLHSLMGLWLVIFIIGHLFTNSQAALFWGDDGRNFINSVNSIHDLPYLYVIEFIFLALPILIHLIWGVKILFTAKYNSFGNTGHTPYLPEYSRNHAYTWQRITSWLLIIGIIAHVVHMRFIDYPTATFKGTEHFYMVRVGADEGLYTLSDRLGVQLYDQQQIETLKANSSENTNLPEAVQKQHQLQEVHWDTALKKRPLEKGEVIAVSSNFGTAELLMLRDTFKSPTMLVLYSLLVIFTCYHAFNGLWTFMIVWGVTLTERSQKLMQKLSTLLMVLFTCLGLAAVWMTYWINLKQ